MTSKESAIGIAALLYERLGFVLLPSCISPRVLENCLSIVDAVRPCDWVWGDDTRHRWREFSASQLLPMSAVVKVSTIEGILARKISRSFQWVNVMKAGQFIARHRDAAGDAQIVVPLYVPPRAAGGQLWLNRKENLVPAGKGDLVLFKARRIFHGTTKVKGLANSRVTLNIRLWFV